MTRDVGITLITKTETDDIYGIPQPSAEARTEVMARIESVSRSEFFEAGRNGLKPEYKFTMFLYDYSGQTEIEYNDTRYTVYRTYMGSSDTIELYVTLKGVTNNG